MRRPLIVLALAGCAATAAGCGSAPAAAPPVLRRAPEPAVSPPVTVAAPGRLIPVGHAPEGLVVDAVTGLVAVSVRRPGPPGDGVELVDLASGAIRGFDPTAGSARHLQLAAPGGPVLAPAEGSDTVYAAALTAAGVVGNARTGRQPHDAAAVGDRVLVTDELADRVTVVAGLADGPGAARVTATVPVPVQPGGIAGGVESDGRTPVALVVGVRGRQVEALTPAGADLGRAAAGAGPTHVRAGDGRFYVADTTGGRVLVYRVGPHGPRQVASVATPGGAPYGVAVDAARHRVFVTLTAANTLAEYSTAGDGLRLVRTWPTPRQPNDVAVDPTTGEVVVAGTGADVLQVLAP